MRNLRLLLGAGIVTLLVVFAVFAPVIAPHDPQAQDLLNQLLPPFWVAKADPHYFLGTDNLGRDLLARLVFAARPALVVTLTGGLLSALIGTTLGILAGYFRGWSDGVLSRVVDIFMSFPPILLAIVLAAAMGPGLGTVVIAIVLIGWTRFYRVVRGEALVMRELDFIVSARIVGVAPARLLLHEVLPNLAPLLTVLLGLELGRALVVEAIMSFIGFSTSDIPTWGAIIADGRSYVYQAWWVMTFPIIVIVVCVLGFNALGDGLRQAFDPVLRR